MATLYEYYNTGDVAGATAYLSDDKPRGQTFTSATAFNIASVKLKLYRAVADDPGIITVAIHSTSGGVPVGDALISGTTDGSTLTTAAAGEWREITFDTDRVMAADVMYAIVITAVSGSPALALRFKGDNTGPTYTGGTFVYSEDTGSTWTAHATIDLMFECWGDTPAFAAPSDRITIKKLVVFANDKVFYEDE